MARRLGVGVVIAVELVFGVAGVGCTKASAGSTSSGGGAGTSTGGVSGSSSGGTGTSSGTTSVTSGGAQSTDTTGTTSGGSPFVDGGYVYCSLPNADGGTARWMCRPGTYFCDPGKLGDCFQCRSDADCADQGLPTFNPLRPRCDLDSGIAGYESFCQECLQNADCAGNPAGSLCDTNPTYPPNALEPPIEDLGFETCGRIQSDCRLEGGPDCHVANQVCDAFNGQCEARSSSCTSDADCAGLLIPTPADSKSGSPYLLRPYCVNGTCNACDGGVCPGHCTSDSQCGGFWPTCIGLDGGNVPDGGEPIGICSCTSDAECGDGGLACLPPLDVSEFWSLPSIFGAQAGNNFCGVPCTSPVFSSCAALAGVDICNLATRLCDWCLTDEQCDSSAGSGGPYCDGPFVNEPPPPGYCGCLLDSDCPDGDSCLSYQSHSEFIGICKPTFSRCTPESCGGFFCNWDSGACVSEANIESLSSCVIDADCSDPFAVCLEGQCVGCRDDADCVHAGKSRATLCCARARADPACSGLGDVCVSHCVSDADCAGNQDGPSCQNGQCGCLASAGCSAGSRCSGAGPGLAGTCVNNCLEDGGCPAHFGCDSRNTCRPPCTDSRDCDGGLSCSGNFCAPCAGDADCAAGKICLADGLCHAACLGPADCPDGQGCDSQTHTCGTCRGPTADGGPFDCPPDAVCSNYWLGTAGACLPSCDRESCPARRPICAVLPSLTPDHKYCFGCLQDADCGDGGAWCDQSFNRTFICRPGG